MDRRGLPGPVSSSVLISRRSFVTGCGAAGLASAGCKARASGPALTPEGFGAAGDGVSDDFAAFERLAAALSVTGGGSVALAPGRTYFFARHVRSKSDPLGIVFENCDGLAIDGNGATIAVDGAFERSDAVTRSLWGLLFRDCRKVSIRHLTLDGNVDQTRRSPAVGEASTHGLILQSCADVAIQGLAVHHFAGDGLYVRESKRTDALGARLASRRLQVRDSTFLFNARQGLSVIQLRSGLFDNCDFSYTGYVDAAGTRGPYGGHSPAAGVDVEPNNTPFHGDRVDVLTGDLHFRRCRMSGNYGAAFLASKYALGQHFMDEVRLDGCDLTCNEGLTGGRDGFIFDVPGGEVTGCDLQMVDKTAYLGWNRESRANPRFVGNSISGRNPAPGHPLLEIRPTRGAPLVEDNRFVALGSAPVDPKLLLSVRNPGAIVRGNQLVSGGEEGGGG